MSSGIAIQSPAVQIIKGDLLQVQQGIIVHQVNAKGKMGAGLAARVRAKYPIAYESYKLCCDRGQLRPGMIQMISVNFQTGGFQKDSNLWVCNLCGQDGYGRDKQYTDYAALKTALIKLYGWASGDPIYFPYQMGCKLGGGDWNVVYELIAQCCPGSIILNPE